MGLQTTGPISITDIATEFGDTAPHSLSEFYGAAAGIPTSGAINVKGFYGKSSLFSFNITSNQTDANLYTLAVNAGWDETSALEAVIDSGVVVTASTTTVPALTISGTYPSGVTLVNNGTIVGDGGNGGSSNGGGFAGGTALSVSSTLAVTNNGTIAGGGGGGGAGNSYSSTYYSYYCTGDDAPFYCYTYPVTSYNAGGGGGGGQTGLTESLGGSGRYGGSNGGNGYYYSAGTAGNNGGAAGGTWGQNGNTGDYSGGTAGSAVSGNSNITWNTSGTIYGALS